jgi:hypothetical protein
VDSDIFAVEGAELDGLIEHPLCAFVPASVGVSVRGSIAQPVVLLDGMILDGRARVLEARRLRLPCPCRAFDPDRDPHPAMLIGSAASTRLEKPQHRAVMAARLAREIESRPECLASYDRGMADRIRTTEGRKTLVKACGASYRHFQRALGIDPQLLQAVSAGRIALDDASHLRDLSTATRRRILALSPAQQKAAIDRAVGKRAKGQQSRQSNFTFDTWVRVVRDSADLHFLDPDRPSHNPSLDRLRKMKKQ